MPVIYKPLRQFMSPNNTIIDPSESNRFSVVVDGQQCIGYRFQVRDNNNNIIQAASTSRVDLSPILYNGDKLYHDVTASSLEAGNGYRWCVDLYGRDVIASMSSTPVAVTSCVDADSYMAISDSTLVTGDSVCFSSTESLPSPLTSTSPYYMRRPAEFDESCVVDNIYLYYTRDDANNDTNRILFDGTTASAGTITMYKNSDFVSNNHNFETGDIVYVSIGFTGTIGTTIKTYTPYYVRKFDSDSFAIYEYLEGARNDSGRVFIGGEIVYEPTISSVAISEQINFKAYSKPTITLTSVNINKPTYKFVPTYEQAEGIILNNYTVSVAMDTADNIKSSEKIYRSKLEYTLDAMLNNHTYYVKFDIENNIGQKATTGFIAFVVSYTTPKVGIKPTLVNNEDMACMSLTWVEIIDVRGSVAGGYEYISNFIADGNYAIHLQSGSTLRYSGINKKLTGNYPMFGWSVNSDSWSGTIIRLNNTTTGNYVEIRYNNGIFYKVINGIAVPILAKRVIAGRYYYACYLNGSLLIIDGEDGVWS